MKSFNLVKFSAKAQQLVQFFGVSPEFAQEVEKLLEPLDQKDKKYIYNFIKDNKIDSTEKLQALQVRIQRQIEISKSKGIDQQVVAIVQKITSNAKYQKWLGGLIQNNLVPQEDLVKVKELLEKFTSLCDQEVIPANQRDIYSYKSVQDLYKTIEGYSAETSDGKMPPPEIGYKVLEDNENIKLVETFTDEAITAIAKMRKPMANWCVAKGTKYNPHRFYCFIINGLPEILVHPESEQIKDYADSTISNLKDIETIYPYLEKYNLFPKGYDSLPTDINSVEREIREEIEDSDFFKLKYKKSKIDLFKKLLAEDSQSSNALVKHEITTDLSLMSLLPEDKIMKYLPTFHYVIENQFKISQNKRRPLINLIKVDEINKKTLALYLNWVKVNGKDLSLYNSMMISHISNPYVFAEYTNLIPDDIKTPEIKEFYKEKMEELDEAIQHADVIPNTCYVYFHRALHNGRITKKWIDSVHQGIHKFIYSGIKKIPTYYNKIITSPDFPNEYLNEIKDESIKIIKETKPDKEALNGNRLENEIRKKISQQDRENIENNTQRAFITMDPTIIKNEKTLDSCAELIIHKKYLSNSYNLTNLKDILNLFDQNEISILDKYSLFKIRQIEALNGDTELDKFIVAYIIARLYEAEPPFMAFAIIESLKLNTSFNRTTGKTIFLILKWLTWKINTIKPGDFLYLLLLELSCVLPPTESASSEQNSLNSIIYMFCQKVINIFNDEFAKTCLQKP